ncbi:MAG: TRAP transporter small permease [Desulfococcaceae bacterium]
MKFAKFTELLDKTSQTVNRCTEFLLFVLGISMALIVALQVFSRYVLNHSLFWSEELARFLLVWLSFLGASSAYHRGVHPGVDVFFVRMPQSLQKISLILVHTVSLSLFGIMIFFGCRFAWFVRAQISPALLMPKWIIMSIIPISGALLALHGLSFLMSAFRRKNDH